MDSERMGGQNVERARDMHRLQCKSHGVNEYLDRVVEWMYVNWSWGSMYCDVPQNVNDTKKWNVLRWWWWGGGEDAIYPP
jgi:hypothetical protein